MGSKKRIFGMAPGQARPGRAARQRLWRFGDLKVRFPGAFLCIKIYPAGAMQQSHTIDETYTFAINLEFAFAVHITFSFLLYLS